MIKNLIKMIPKASSIIQFTLAISTLSLTIIISLEQNRIAKMEYQPVFILSKEQLYRKDYTPTQSERFDIYNEGFPINNYSYDFHSIIQINYTSNYKLYKSKIEIDYFSVHSKKSGGKGRMSGGIGEDNILLFSKLKSEIIEKIKKQGIESVNIELNHLVKISYSDMEFNEKDVYFSGSERITKEEHDKYLEDIDDFYTISIFHPDIDEIVSKSLKHQ
ncbi:hypothetical protein [Pectobacterium carotovorum]|uniref:hypothetical protein n=1 Tax=Pectobacterium carotovorum TaxID=554 RepID=UPI0015DD61E2|nr:hypothetical protein [Pectobacterium carotovorum]MBA0175198.1 hypothetical protein [Pectobacterium carotovorum]